MNRIRISLQSLSVGIILLAVSSLAQAQATRTWVSGVGDDANPCSRTAPCKTFAGAISKTAAKGEINVLDPGGFGAVTITKSITISSTFEAGILVSGGNGVNVVAGATDKVILKGLDFEGLGTAGTGIRYASGGQVLVENCTINGFATAGIDVDFTGQPSMTAAALDVNNTRISNSAIGIRINNPVGSATGQINNVQITNLTGNAIQTMNNTFVNVTNTVIDRTVAGLDAENNSAIYASNSSFNLSQNGVQVLATTATIRLASCDIYLNTVGINNSGGGKVISFGNNRLAGNVTQGAPTQTIGTI